MSRISGETPRGRQATETSADDRDQLQWLGPPHIAPLTCPDGRGFRRGEHGDSVEICLRMGGDSIMEATFASDGCGSAYAAANEITRIICGLSLREAAKIKASDVLERLGELVKGHERCAVIVIAALHEAIADVRRSRTSQRGHSKNL